MFWNLLLVQNLKCVGPKFGHNLTYTPSDFLHVTLWGPLIRRNFCNPSDPEMRMSICRTRASRSTTKVPPSAMTESFTGESGRSSPSPRWWRWPKWSATPGCQSIPPDRGRTGGCTWVRERRWRWTRGSQSGWQSHKSISSRLPITHLQNIHIGWSSIIGIGIFSSPSADYLYLITHIL